MKTLIHQPKTKDDQTRVGSRWQALFGHGSLWISTLKDPEKAKVLTQRPAKLMSIAAIGPQMGNG
jgi:hypothetical protein